VCATGAYEAINRICDRGDLGIATYIPGSVCNEQTGTCECASGDITVLGSDIPSGGKTAECFGRRNMHITFTSATLMLFMIASACFHQQDVLYMLVCQLQHMCTLICKSQHTTASCGTTSNNEVVICETSEQSTCGVDAVGNKQCQCKDSVPVTYCSKTLTVSPNVPTVYAYCGGEFLNSNSSNTY
jgi:hypothetical protein